MEGYFLHIAAKLDRIRLQEGDAGLSILRELKSWSLWRAVLAEGMATMLFVLIGTMSVMDPGGTDEGDKNAKYIRIAFAFGLMIAVCIQMIGHVSGGHMNPAVSIAMAVVMAISPTRALLYVVAQCIGGILGSLILKGVTPEVLHGNLAVTGLAGHLDAGQGIACEGIFTFILVLSIMGCTDSNRPLFGSPAIGIGLTIAVVHLAAIPFTGASMNPARSLGSAVISDVYKDHWVYWIGPIGGGIIAALAYKYILNPYRGCISYENAANKMCGDSDMIVVPKSYFSEITSVQKKVESHSHL